MRRLAVILVAVVGSLGLTACEPLSPFDDPGVRRVCDIYGRYSNECTNSMCSWWYRTHPWIPGVSQPCPYR